MVCVLVENLKWATPRIRQAPCGSYSPCWLVDHHFGFGQKGPHLVGKGKDQWEPQCSWCHTTSEAVPLLRHVLGRHKVLQSRT